MRRHCRRCAGDGGRALKPGRVLIVAGSDSGGGAGIQADIKTVTALGSYAATAITALTVQDTLGVHGVLPVMPEFVAAQMRAVLRDIGADAIKTGMLGNTALIATVAATLRAEAPDLPFVLDPVMVAKGGARLLPADAVAALVGDLVPLATVLTPNAPEAEVLAGVPVTDEAAAREAARRVLQLGPRAVLVKGGHLPGPVVTDLLATRDGVVAMSDARIETRHTHGTGCTLASAIAAGLAEGRNLYDAVSRARAYVRQAIVSAPGFGGGHGPLGHACTVSADALARLSAA